MKRLFTLLLCVVMMASMFTVAFAEETEYDVVRILCNNDYDANNKVEDWEKYDVSQIFIKMLEEVGVKIELECVDRSSLANIVATRMSAGVDLPDMVAYLDSADDVLAWADAGLVLAASDLVAEYDTDNSIINFINERCPGGWESTTAPDGKVYWFSALSNISNNYIDDNGEIFAAKPYNAFTPLFRYQWLENIGVEYKDFYTPEEVYDILVAMREQDANGNGLQDEVITIEIDNFKNGFAVPYGLNQDLLIGVNGDGEVFSNFKHPAFKDYIEFMQSLVEAGLYDTTCLNSDNISTVIADDRSALVYDGANFGSWEQYIKHLYPSSEYPGHLERLYAPFIMDLDGDYTTGFHANGDALIKASKRFFVTSACKNPEAVVRLMEVVYSNEYALLSDRGIEGVTYTLNEDGSATTINIPAEEKDDIKQKTLSATGLAEYALPCLRVSTRVSNLMSKQPQDSGYYKHYFVAKLRTQYMEYGTWEQHDIPQAIATAEELAVANEYKAVLETYAAELLTDLILGRKSLDNLDTYLAEMDSLGLEEYCEMVIARYNRAIGK